ncbi:hypothetical protein G6F22_020252 [Rhizopus arrhizus]|nr:hypothetical protein G6F22_020252 [Rhizopus arrhizus]KAG0911883.1 hypothetical protein G6F32_016734 [Rhizopus arrhizus]
MATEFTMARIRLGCANTVRKASSDSTSNSDTPMPQLDTKARSNTPSSGTTMVTSSQNATTAPATQRHLPSGSGRAREALPLTVTKRLAVRIRRRCSMTSGIVMQIRITATAAIRW